jgi:hypothetical protein
MENECSSNVVSSRPPGELQSYFVYAAAMMTNAPSADAAKAFTRYLGLPAAKAIFDAAGAN